MYPAQENIFSPLLPMACADKATRNAGCKHNPLSSDGGRDGTIADNF